MSFFYAFTHYNAKVLRAKTVAKQNVVMLYSNQRKHPMKLKIKKDSKKKVMPKTRNPKTPLKVKTNVKSGSWDWLWKWPEPEE
ncbi:MAG: hypothetical protein DRR16_19465 [Candidatus Parabeggiatoa sp. nov. 3]|jgi:hypothetical protein|nr:MAG: hypothetical protein DRR00_24030 [Gammaproteobacteria bacterium]RKZ61188.1 MAG: hypothetical protein DRQ99_20875 [Gammaproteobacteria bacterium]RKZ82531.1 MAG: hypothetical protein DRR16_19465 [Gammaproteobacteria bacterium]